MLRTRFTLGLLPLLLLFLVVGVYAIRLSQELGDSVEDLFARNFRSIRVVRDLREAAAQMNVALGDARQGGNLAGARRRFVEQSTRFQRSLNDELVAQPEADRAELLNALDAQERVFVRAGSETLRLGSLGGLDLMKEAETAFFTLNRSLDELLERDYRAIYGAETRMRDRIDASLRLLVGAMLGAVALFFYLAWRLAHSFLQPIQALTASATALGAGDLEREVPVTSKDELGQLAKAFNAMAVHLRAYRDATLAKVLRTQRTMEATLTSTPEPVFVVGRDGTQEVRNPAAEQLAQSPDFAAGFPPALAEPLAAVLATGTHYLPTDYARVVTLRVAREDRHYLPRILAIGDKLTEFKGAAVILQDVTKFRLLDDAKTNLVGTVSHELKSPLTSLRMAVYLLLEQKIAGLTPTQQELLETARRCRPAPAHPRQPAGSRAAGGRRLEPGPEPHAGRGPARRGGGGGPGFPRAGGADAGGAARSRAGGRGDQRGCRAAAPRVHQPAHERREVLPAARDRDPRRRVRPARVCPLCGQRSGPGRPARGAAACVRPVLSRPRPGQHRRRARLSDRPRDCRGPWRQHQLHRRARLRHDLPVPAAAVRILTTKGPKPAMSSIKPIARGTAGHSMQP